MFAVIESGGKQYKVTEGETILVDLFDTPEDSKVVFDKVLLVTQDENVVIGQPTVANATVEGEYIRMEKGKKLDVFKMKRRKSFEKKTGHRQKYSLVKILKINLTDETPKKKRAAKTAAAEADTSVDELKNTAETVVVAAEEKVKKPSARAKVKAESADTEVAEVKEVTEVKEVKRRSKAKSEEEQSE